MLSCNHDCFNCPYPDVPDECLSAPLTYDEYKESSRIDSKSRYEQKTNAQKKVAAQRKAWYEANREKVAAQHKAWYEANREKVAAQQKCIRVARKSRRMRQSDLASLVGVNQSKISLWESGKVPANWDNLCAVLPELEEYRP